ncbi:MAG: hypothetical protein GYB27_21155 [Rhodobacteraceae bacterium]|nr:hypothetical protein [Paracoccaceae bacterium]
MKILLAATLPLTLLGCTQPFEPPAVTPLIRATDPNIVKSAAPGPSVVHTSRPIVEPEDWRQLNDAQAPGGSS